MCVSNINPCCFQGLKDRRTLGQSRGGAATGDNQVPSQAQVGGVAMLFSSAGLTDAEIRASLDQMAHDITMQSQAMTDQVNQQNVQWENPHVRSMADRLKDFTRMNPLIFIMSKNERITTSLWMRYIRLWWMWGPQKAREKTWLPMNSRILHTLGE